MKIDWLSFTREFPFTNDGVRGRDFSLRCLHIRDRLLDQFPALHAVTDVWIETQAQRPYTHSLKCVNTGVQMHFAYYRNECLVTVSGEACSRLYDAQAMLQALTLAQHTATRLDLAYDVKTQVTPQEVLHAGISGRYKTVSELTSAKGDTVYIGSRTSDFFVRIYRYNSPHPRHELLRFEFEVKGENAQAIAQECVMSGIAPVMRGLAERYGFKHQQTLKWFEGKTVNVRTVAHNRQAAKTELWLIKQAAPAFQRLVKDGVITDPAEWVQRYLLGGEKQAILK